MTEAAADAVLISTGIMSATLGTFLKELEPSLSTSILETRPTARWKPWVYLVETGAIPDPPDFIHPCPHMSFVWSEANAPQRQSSSRSASSRNTSPISSRNPPGSRS
jgi:hypothetical protein